MQSGKAAVVAICVVISAVGIAQLPTQTRKRHFQFEQFPAEVYKGPIRIPSNLHRDAEGAWRDDLGKLVDEPEVTFAGEYYLAGHSCGTGEEIRQVDQFDAGEEPPKTADGHPYLTILYGRPDSRLLIAEYHLDFDDPNKQETCRQRYFVLEGGKLKPISKTFSFCTEDSEARQ